MQINRVPTPGLALVWDNGKFLPIISHCQSRMGSSRNAICGLKHLKTVKLQTVFIMQSSKFHRDGSVKTIKIFPQFNDSSPSAVRLGPFRGLSWDYGSILLAVAGAWVVRKTRIAEAIDEATLEANFKNVAVASNRQARHKNYRSPQKSNY